MTKTLVDFVHVVWPAPEGHKNKAILPALDKIERAGGKVEEIQVSLLAELARMMKLPLLETPEGDRHYGVRAIQIYAESL